MMMKALGDIPLLLYDSFVVLTCTFDTAHS
jgi:hypothetical protein